MATGNDAVGTVELIFGAHFFGMTVLYAPEDPLKAEVE